MWGTLAKTLTGRPLSRITPTCVGNTFLECINEVLGEDHPHLCGEHPAVLIASLMSLGSPPPVWGTLFTRFVNLSEHRITPTCVGNTLARLLRRIVAKDHPHLCGEHPCRPSLTRWMNGSPPPVWGTLLTSKGCSIMYRITPTCVGNTP